MLYPQRLAVHQVWDPLWLSLPMGLAPAWYGSVPPGIPGWLGLVEHGLPRVRATAVNCTQDEAAIGISC